MSALLRTTGRAGLVGGLAALVVVGTAGLATAASGPVPYSCAWASTRGNEPVDSGTVSTTAQFDSAIPDGLEVTAGETVNVAPFTGSVVIPAALVATLRGEEVTEVDGGGTTATGIREAGPAAVDETDFDGAATPVPESGALTVDLADVQLFEEPSRAGTNTLITTGTLTVNLTSLPQGFSLRLDCELVDADDAVIDTFVGIAAPTTPTPTPTASATPVRPEVVQTDFAGDDSPSALPLVLGGTGLMTAGAALVALRVRGPSTSRRH